MAQRKPLSKRMTPLRRGKPPLDDEPEPRRLGGMRIGGGEPPKPRRRSREKSLLDMIRESGLDPKDPRVKRAVRRMMSREA